MGWWGTAAVVKRFPEPGGPPPIRGNDSAPCRSLETGTLRVDRKTMAPAVREGPDWPSLNQDEREYLISKMKPHERLFALRRGLLPPRGPQTTSGPLVGTRSPRQPAPAAPPPPPIPLPPSLPTASDGTRVSPRIRSCRDRDWSAEDFQPWTRHIDKDFDREPWFRNMEITIRMALAKLEWIMRQHLKYLSDKVGPGPPDPSRTWWSRAAGGGGLTSPDRAGLRDVQGPEHAPEAPPPPRVQEGGPSRDGPGFHRAVCAGERLRGRGGSGRRRGAERDRREAEGGPRAKASGPLRRSSRTSPTPPAFPQLWQNVLNLMDHEEVEKKVNGKTRKVLQPIGRRFIDRGTVAAIFCKYGFNK